MVRGVSHHHKQIVQRRNLEDGRQHFLLALAALDDAIDHGQDVLDGDDVKN